MEAQDLLGKPSAANQADRPLTCEIRVKGHLGQQWAEWFPGLTILLEEEGNTRLSGPMVDQAALHGLLKKVRDLGMPLLSVEVRV